MWVNSKFSLTEVVISAWTMIYLPESLLCITTREVIIIY